MAANIREYGAPKGLGLQPDETGVTATAAAARRIQGAYNESAAAITDQGQRIASTVKEVGDVGLKFVEHQEISHGAKGMAGLIAKKTQEWNEVSKQADANDPTVVQKFIEKNLEPSLEQFRGGFNTERGQQWMESHIDAFRNHMVQKASADMATNAKHAVTGNIMSVANTLSATAWNDPSAVKFLLGQTDTMIDGITSTSPNLAAGEHGRIKNELTQKIREQIVKAAVLGAISKDPDAGAAMMKDPALSPYINGAEVKQFEHAVRMQKRIDQSEARQAENWQHTQNVRAANDAYTKNLSDNTVIDENGKITLKPGYFKSALDLARLPDAPAHLAESAIKFGEHVQNEKEAPLISDPATRDAIARKLVDPTTNLNDLTVDLVRARTDRKLSDREYSRFDQSIKTLQQQPVKNPGFKDAMDAAKSAMTYSFVSLGAPGKDPKGLALYASFVQSFIPQFLQLEREGKLPANALDLKDPESMISKAMVPYKRTTQEMINDKVAEFGSITAGSGGAAPEAPWVAPRISTEAERKAIPKGKGYWWTGPDKDGNVTTTFKMRQ